MIKDIVLKIENDKNSKNYDECYSKFKEIIYNEFVNKNTYYSGATEALLALIPSKLLYDVCGFGNKEGYTYWDMSGVLERLSFISFFFSHELLDDGTPVIRWHKYDLNSQKMIECKKEDKFSKPYWSPNDTDGHEYLTFDKVIWTLNWHKSRDEEVKSYLGTRRVLFSDNEDNKYNELLEGIVSELSEYRDSLLKND